MSNFDYAEARFGTQRAWRSTGRLDLSAGHSALTAAFREIAEEAGLSYELSDSDKAAIAAVSAGPTIGELAAVAKSDTCAHLAAVAARPDIAAALPQAPVIPEQQ